MSTSNNPISLIPSILVYAWLILTMALWLLAFYHTDAESQVWLARIQNVCFGTNESGLPDTYGWLILVCGPLSLIAAMLVALKSEIFSGLAIINRRPPFVAMSMVIVALFVYQAVWTNNRIQTGLEIINTEYEFTTSENLPDTYPRNSKPVVDFSLVDQNNQRVGPSKYKGKAVYVTFAFAHCQTICPAIVSSVLKAASNFDQEAVEVLVITLDPWRDTPSSLPSLAKKWKFPKNAHILSGSIEEVSSVLDQYNVARSKDEKTGDIDHPALVYVISPEGKQEYVFNNPYTTWLVDSVDRLNKIEES